MGQDPGEQEERKLEPFVGNTGKRIKAIWALGCNENNFVHPPDRIYITNGAKCRPVTKHEAEARAAMTCCRPLLMRELRMLKQPRAVLAMGKWAHFALTGEDQGVGHLHGFHVPVSLDEMERVMVKQVKAIHEKQVKAAKKAKLPAPTFPSLPLSERGSGIDAKDKRMWMVPVVHPAFTFRQVMTLGPLIAHVSGFIGRLKDGFPPPPILLADPPVTELRKLIAECRRRKLGIAVDVESKPPAKWRGPVVGYWKDKTPPTEWALLPGYAELRALGAGADIGPGIGLSWFYPVPSNVWEEFKAMLEDPTIIKIGMNSIYYDWPLLKRYGMEAR